MKFFDEDRRMRSLPADWTSLAPFDPFVAVSAGRVPFRVENLERLGGLLRDLDRTIGAEEG